MTHATAATSTRRLRRAPEWVVALSVTVAAMVLCVIPGMATAAPPAGILGSLTITPAMALDPKV